MNPVSSVMTVGSHQINQVDQILLRISLVISVSSVPKIRASSSAKNAKAAYNVSLT